MELQYDNDCTNTIVTEPSTNTNTSINKNVSCDSIYDYLNKEEHKQRTMTEMKPLDKLFPFLIFHVVDNHAVFDYRYIKHNLNETNYPTILDHCIFVFSNILTNFPQIILHLCLKRMTVLDLEKNYKLLSHFCNTMKTRFPNKLKICYIYKPPFIFSQIIKLLSPFIDKETQAKMVLYQKDAK